MQLGLPLMKVVIAIGDAVACGLVGEHLVNDHILEAVHWLCRTAGDECA